jgi:hypothetical protein
LSHFITAAILISSSVVQSRGSDWQLSSSRVLESVKAGKRLPEARFANLKVAASGQRSVLGAFSNVQLKDATMQEAASSFISGKP